MIDSTKDVFEEATKRNKSDSDDDHKPINRAPPILRPDRFTDLVKFPSEFDNEVDALTAYNEFGSWHKVQFKITSKSYRSDGVL